MTGINSNRKSNIELLRIVAMFFVVAHHFVCNSGMTEAFDYSHPSANMMFLQWFGAWGKTAINVFVLITGYFMCTGELTPRRFIKLLLEVVFYNIAVYAVLLLAGYESTSPKRIFELCGSFFRGINDGFIVSFLWFYLGIPFYNVLIKRLSRREIFLLIGLLLLHFSASSTFFAAKYSFNHTFWYMTLYFIGAAIRLYPMSWMSQKYVCLYSLFGCICFATVWMWGIAPMISRGGGGNFQYWLISDSDKILALAIGILMFLVFKNIEIAYRRPINGVASTVFGVLLIHGHGDAMRQWLWHDFLAVAEHYDMPFAGLVAYSIACVVGVFVGCSAIDYLRLRFVEPVFLSLFSNVEKQKIGCRPQTTMGQSR